MKGARSRPSRDKLRVTLQIKPGTGKKKIGRARYIVPLRRKTVGVQINGTRKKIVTALAVGKHLLDAGYVRFVDQRQLLELAHASRRLGTHQMALARVPALDFAVGGELEALPGAAVRFQFQFWFRCVSRHC